MCAASASPTKRWQRASPVTPRDREPPGAERYHPAVHSDIGQPRRGVRRAAPRRRGRTAVAQVPALASVMTSCVERNPANPERAAATRGIDLTTTSVLNRGPIVLGSNATVPPGSPRHTRLPHSYRGENRGTARFRPPRLSYRWATRLCTDTTGWTPHPRRRTRIRQRERRRNCARAVGRSAFADAYYAAKAWSLPSRAATSSWPLATTGAAKTAPAIVVALRHSSRPLLASRAKTWLPSPSPK